MLQPVIAADVFVLIRRKIISEAYRTYPARHIFRFTAYDPLLRYYIKTSQLFAFLKRSS